MGWGRDLKYDKYLNKDDAIDNAILKLVQEGKLSIGFVKINDKNREDMKCYSRDILLIKGKNTS